ncbi:MAG TPA: nucleotidyl transferase AbiEii/AbiGii toxin family protein [Aquella sp.]|nr:nucleotidyl transferase AbiEii/AbiGii toxin family protein [Aquella sp.]
MIDQCAEKMQFSSQIIEKDVWVCWVLEQLFLLPDPLVFKGGTSLSKGYGLINRFSEDTKNTIDPYQEKILTTYLSHSTNILLPSPNVKILHPKRTFWEKATLMHVECNRKIRENKGSRLSRHWYDMYMLCQSEVKNEALKDISLFNSVLAHKITFYNNSLANYENCKDGKFRLIPDSDDIKKLTDDYNQMVRAGMFAGQPVGFSQILENLQRLELELNISCMVEN